MTNIKKAIAIIAMLATVTACFAGCSDGGLIYATFTTLFIIPIIYDIFNRKEMKKIDNAELDFIDE